MERIIAAVSALAVFTLGGCASPDYAGYLKANAELAKSRSEERIQDSKEKEAKWKVMQTIANSGDTSAKTIAAVTVALSDKGDSHQQQPELMLMPPKSGWEITRDLLGIFVPAVIQGYGIHANQVISTTSSNNATLLGMRQSDNATASTLGTNQSFVDVAGKIQAPAANMTISGSGVIGAGSYTAPTDYHGITGSYNPVSTTPGTTCTVNPTTGVLTCL